MQDYQEQRRELVALLRSGLPANRAARIESQIRDTIAITPREPRKADSAVGATRLGGSPDLPEGQAWPSQEDGRVEFVGQLRLEELAPFDIHHRLPPTGLLSFFHGFLTGGEYGVEGHVFYFPDAPRGLAPVFDPHRKRRGQPRPVGVELAPLALLPPHSSHLVPREGPDDPYVTLYDARYHELYDGDLRFHGLFGFERPLEHGEGEQREDEEMLLRLDAGGVPYDFVEAACAYYYVAKRDLERRDFSSVRLLEGATI